MTVYLGLVEYEIAGGVTQTTSYYHVPGARVVRVNGALSYVLTDHLGSSSVTLDSTGGVVGELRYYAYGATRVSTGGLHAELRYKPWGETRYTSGTTPTSVRFTSQHEESGLGGMYFYDARWYDPVVSRFLSADTIVPESGNPQALNRFSFVANNPIKYLDPSGHCWGLAGGIRGLPSYDTTCNNLDMALTIVAHPVETLQQEDGVRGYVLASAYLVGEGTAHVVAATYGGVAACAMASATCFHAVTSGSGILGLLCQDGDCSNEAKAASQAATSANTLLNQVSKLDARTALRNGIDLLTNGQTKKALEVLQSGRVDRFTLESLQNGQVRIVADRVGSDGFQRLIYTLDPSGKTIGLIQQAYNAAGELVHHHDKLTNVINK